MGQHYPQETTSSRSVPVTPLLDIRKSATVYGSDGGKIGTVVMAFQNYLIVERGFFFPTDYYVPVSSIDQFDDDRVYLTLPRDAALTQGWDRFPGGTESRPMPENDSVDAAAKHDGPAPSPPEPAAKATDVSPVGDHGNAHYPDTYAVGTNTESYHAITDIDRAESRDAPGLADATSVEGTPDQEDHSAESRSQ